MKLKYYLLYGVIYALVAGTICMEQKKITEQKYSKAWTKEKPTFFLVCVHAL